VNDAVVLGLMILIRIADAAHNTCSGGASEACAAAATIPA